MSAETPWLNLAEASAYALADQITREMVEAFRAQRPRVAGNPGLSPRVREIETALGVQ